jgi:hypothetical protein
MEDGNAPWRHRIKVLMGNRVSPVEQLLKQFPPALVTSVQGVHVGPKVNSQSVEIRANRARLRIASSQTPIPNKLDSQKVLKRRLNDGDDTINALGMEVSTETLKVARQEGGIGIIDLLSRIPPSPFRPANHGVGVGNFV